MKTRFKMLRKEHIFKLSNERIGDLFLTASIETWSIEYQPPRYDFDWLQNNSDTALSKYTLDVKTRCQHQYNVELVIDMNFWKTICEEHFNTVKFDMMVYEKPNDHSFLSYKGMIMTIGVEPIAQLAECYMIETKYFEGVNGESKGLLRLKGYSL